MFLTPYGQFDFLERVPVGLSILVMSGSVIGNRNERIRAAHQIIPREIGGTTNAGSKPNPGNNQ